MDARLLKGEMMFRWPDTSERTVIVGRTGSGKSVMGAHIVSNAPFDKMPYIIIDYKGEDLFNAIQKARDLEPGDKIPKEPGIYILHATPKKDDAKVEDFLWRVHAKGKTGLVYDEGYMIPDVSAMNAIYTQGRSKRIPVITLSQRPRFLSRFAFTESEHKFIFDLDDIDDKRRIREFVPNQNPIWALDFEPPEYHCRYYFVKKKYSAILLPAPKPDDILDKIDFRLRPKRKIF